MSIEQESSHDGQNPLSKELDQKAMSAPNLSEKDLANIIILTSLYRIEEALESDILNND